MARHTLSPCRSTLCARTSHHRPVRSTCRSLEHQPVGEQKRTETWPCDLADEFQQRVGRNKVEISRHFIARVQFPLAGGRMREASADDVKLGSYSLSVGATLPVVYARTTRPMSAPRC